LLREKIRVKATFACARASESVEIVRQTQSAKSRGLKNYAKFSHNFDWRSKGIASKGFVPSDYAKFSHGIERDDDDRKHLREIGPDGDANET
jgi:hypothetical protein